VSHTQRVGKIGEDIAVKYLKSRGFEVVFRNYRLKCGELDIVAIRSNILYFVEVKAVSREINKNIQILRPEDHLHQRKIDRLERTISVYLDEFRYTGEWKLIAVMVELDHVNKTAFVRILEDFAWRG
jgi:putative endonuclease